MYLKTTSTNPYGGIIAPPVRYPDGRWYVKGSGTSLLRAPLRTEAEMREFVQMSGLESDIEPFRRVLDELVPGIELGAGHTRPCLVTFNESELPYIDEIEPGLVIATEGERGVMCADGIGLLAARLVIDGEWTDPLPRAAFAARFRD
jgi:sarcosine oxidase